MNDEVFASIVKGLRPDTEMSVSGRTWLLPQQECTIEFEPKGTIPKAIRIEVDNNLVEVPLVVIPDGLRSGKVVFSNPFPEKTHFVFALIGVVPTMDQQPLYFSNPETSPN